MQLKSVFTFFILCLVFISIDSFGKGSESYNKSRKDLQVSFNKDAKIEVGSEYVGLEIHHSCILPQRISFYYPVANSIDLSTDYWYRDTAFIMAAGLKIGNGRKQWLGLKSYKFDLTPYSVSFQNQDKQKSISVSYEFCKDKPAMVVSYVIKNTGSKKEEFEFYTHLETSLKTCHTYTLKDKASTEYDKTGNAIYANFDDEETQYADVFAANAGETPVSFNTVGDLNSSRKPDNDWWYMHGGNLPEKTLSKDNPGIPAAVYLYKKELAPGQEMRVVQIIGSCKQNEAKETVNYLLANYKKEVEKYEEYVLDNAYNDGKWNTGDKWIDHSVHWAKAVLAVNKHYIDGDVMPMPCPAEYNFYFTHDVLLTDLAAVNFDLPRVKHDLTFVVKHANSDKIIPHAYYWKDSAYVTEFASSDNWNNFWFVITSASYLRHSGDKKFLEYIYPYLTESINNAMKTKKGDIMYSYRPDWWDIGNNFGPRVYMTILFSKALRDFNYISSVLGKDQDKLIERDELANRMEKQVTDKFWDAKKNYLMNYLSDGSEDPHYYIGSLLAADYGILDEKHTQEIIKTTTDVLLDKQLGVYTAYPMDFLKYEKILGFGDEVGPKYNYFNGGIWSQDNAWYAIALMHNGQKESALNFVRTTMSLDGIMHGPNGQPAYYEVRIPDKDNPKLYGSVDKPQFMWAAGWYLYTIYHLYGIDENDWNINFEPFLSAGQKEFTFTLNANGQHLLVNVSGKGKYIKSIKFGDKYSAFSVIPEDLSGAKDVNIILGKPETPYLASANSSLVSAFYDKAGKKLSIELDSFRGHQTNSVVITTIRPKDILVDGEKLSGVMISKKSGGVYQIDIRNKQKSDKEKIEVIF